MSLKAIDGFDYFPSGQSDAYRDVLWSAAGYYWFPSTFRHPPDVYPGRFGFSSAAGWAINTVAVPTPTFMIIAVDGGSVLTSGIYGIAVYRDSRTTGDPCLTFYDAATNLVQFTVQFTANGVVKIWRGNPPTPQNPQLPGGIGTLLATTGAGVFRDSQWFYVEIKGTISTTVGSVEVRINTSTVLTFSGNTQNTGVVGFDSISWGMNQAANSGQMYGYFDDLYFCDTSGSVNNNFLGNVRVFTQLTSAAGATTDLSIFGPQPTNWQTVQNEVLDDSQYVYTATNGQYDLYKFQAIVTGTTIFGVQPRIAMRQDDATQVTADIVLATGAFTGVGADKTINQTYTYYTDIWEENPDTSLPWTKTDTTLYQFGPKKKS